MSANHGTPRGERHRDLPAVGHLIVIAGPSCVGKSTLLTRLLNGELPELGNAIGLKDVREYELLHAAELKAGYRLATSGVLLHYELTRKKFLLSGSEGDPVLEILRRAERIDFLTLWEYPAAIEGRFRSKVIKALVSEAKQLEFRRAFRTFQRFRLRRPYFTDQHRMWDLYRRWFDVCDQFQTSPHWVLRPSSGNVMPQQLNLTSRALPFWERPLSASSS